MEFGYCGSEAVEVRQVLILAPLEREGSGGVQIADRGGKAGIEVRVVEKVVECSAAGAGVEVGRESEARDGVYSVGLSDWLGVWGGGVGSNLGGVLRGPNDDSRPYRPGLTGWGGHPWERRCRAMGSPWSPPPSLGDWGSRRGRVRRSQSSRGEGAGGLRLQWEGGWLQLGGERIW